jgi:phage-related protein
MMEAVPPTPKLGCRFYATATGAEPVREWLLGLSREVRMEIGSDIRVVQWRWPVSKPLVDGFGAGLYEVRTSHDGNEYRTFFCIVERELVLLHGIAKKTWRTPAHDLKLARRRQREVENEI